MMPFDCYGRTNGLKKGVNKMEEEKKEVKQEEMQVQEQIPDIELPTLELEEYKIPDAEVENIQDISKGALKFAFIGSGQCGGRIAEAFYNIGYRKTVALNTTSHDLKFLKLPTKQKLLLDIGAQGAGKDMMRGNKAVLQYQQEIFDFLRKTFGDNVEHLWITIGAGGGSGGGSVIPLIEIAKKYLKYIGIEEPDKKVGVIVTLPTDGEANSTLVARNAYSVMTDLETKVHISPVIVIDNDKIKKQYRGLTVKDFWPKINSTVTGLFHIFNLLSAQDSPYTSFDPVDYRSILEAGRFLILGLTAVDKYDEEQDISAAIKYNLKKTLLAEDFDLNTAQVAASIAVGGKKIMAEAKGLMDKLNYGFDCLSSLCGNSVIHRGIYEDNKESLRLYTIIGGLEKPSLRMSRLHKMAKL